MTYWRSMEPYWRAAQSWRFDAGERELPSPEAPYVWRERDLDAAVSEAMRPSAPEPVYELMSQPNQSSARSYRKRQKGRAKRRRWE